MTLFKPRLVTVHRPTCLFHQQQLAAAAAMGASKSSPATTPLRVSAAASSSVHRHDRACFQPNKDKSRRTSSTMSLTPQHHQPPSPNVHSESLARVCACLTAMTHSSFLALPGDSELRPSLIPILIPMNTPVTSTLSRTSSRESVLSEHSVTSASSTQQQRRPSKLPLLVTRQKKTSDGP
jgi:hypothetical protein